MLNALPVGLVYHNRLRKFLLVEQDDRWQLPTAEKPAVAPLEANALAHSITVATGVICTPTHRLGEQPIEITNRESYWLCFTDPSCSAMWARGDLLDSEYVDRATLIERTGPCLPSAFKSLLNCIG